MDSLIIPEPYIATGYTGHVPGARHRVGKCFGKLSHSLFVNPCTPHSEILIVSNPNATPKAESNPTRKHIQFLNEREHYVDAKYRHPILPGYEAHVPKMYYKHGERFPAAASLGVIEHQMMQNKLNCEREALRHQDLICSGIGLFNTTVGERLNPNVDYKLPLRPVNPRAKVLKRETCDDKPPKVPYSKYPSPHFLEYEDEEKYIKMGYAGFIPLMQKRYGGHNHALTHSALCEFLKRRRVAALKKWCPREEAVVACPKDNRGADSRDCPDLDYTIYPVDCGMIPNYSGHVPGVYYTVGKVFGQASVNAKDYLKRNRYTGSLSDWECYCLKITEPKKTGCS